ncbi:ribbon-helix-helix protein, CopG family [Streptomyces luteolifulvus]|uniref:Ribbon-helix-helix protein, CopG family n=1 Tax=Streptomyces luteolifulvus TaxID=2615112 RepID=A0A6H9UY54_9ACTN|nr:ribbon-helix-helix protein, CopG family [Streptomyces luteolifulvus]KAB1143516.1 ribbon-helix-helix protein, CopG family [Streptomyces luteolifulvus]
MVRGDRVDGIEYARQVNAAADLLAMEVPVAEAARVPAVRYGVSVRQAHRYVEQAVAQGRVAVPEANVVFTVKLPGSLAEQVRAHARASGATVSSVVAQALADYLRDEAGRWQPPP